MADFNLALSLTFYAIFLPILFNVPLPSNASTSAVSTRLGNAALQVVTKSAQGSRKTAEKLAKENIKASKGANQMPKGEMSKSGMPKGEMSKSGMPKGGMPKGGMPKGEMAKSGMPKGGMPNGEMPNAKWQISPNLPKGVLQQDAFFRYYREMAKKALENVQLGKLIVKKAKSKMLFGLDKMSNGVHLPEKMGVDQGAVRRTMNFLGNRLYEGIWKMSNKMTSLPVKTTIVLAGFFGATEVGHTFDEWFQATLASIINPESVGFSLPRSMEEFNTGLVNAALDILPDFAFAFPLAMLFVNPPAAIVWAGWIAVGEYFAKKSWSLTMRDIILPTKNGQKFKTFLEEKGVPKERVFKIEEEDQEDGEGKNSDTEEETAGEGKNRDTEEETHVPIIQALSDSQVDSNLYQYLYMNTLRACYVVAMSSYSMFMDELKEMDIKDERMTDFAKEVKQTMDKNEQIAKSEIKEEQMKDLAKEVKQQTMDENVEIAKSEKEAAKSKGDGQSKFRWIMGKPKMAKTGEGQTNDTPDQLIEEFKKMKKEPISTQWIESMVHFNEEMLGEMDEDDRKPLEELARAIAQEMVHKNRIKDKNKKEWNESISTTAQIIQTISKSPEVLEEMIMVKIGNKKLPKCEPQIEKAAKLFEQQKNSKVQAALVENEVLTEEVDKSDPFARRPIPFCKLANEKTMAEDREFGFIPLLEEKEVEGVFKKKLKNALTKLQVIKRLGGTEKKQDEQADKNKQLRGAIKKVAKATTSSKVFNEERETNSMRKENTVTIGPKVNTNVRNQKINMGMGALL